MSDYDVLKGEKVPVKMWTKHVPPVESAALDQLRNIASLPFIHKHVAAMPDVHLGKGATVGSVIPTKGAIIPAAVGVDIGCGMVAALTNLTSHDLPESLKEIRHQIERDVPLGQNHHKEDRISMTASVVWRGRLEHEYKWLEEKYPDTTKNQKPWCQIGSLGGGNHFIELCLDEEDRVWLMLHSGSRGIGNKIGNAFIRLAQKDMERMFIKLPDKDLSYFVEGSDHFDDYVRAVGWAQSFASENRRLMVQLILEGLRRKLLPKLAITDTVVNCHHNYVERENHYGENVWLTRKGAVRAREGDLGIIPGSMGARSYIVRGKGNPESFHSCSHGAGRTMSRTEAKRRFTLDDHEKATAQVECRKDEGVIDETPGAYKDIEAVMLSQESLVSVVHVLRQVVCVKG